MARHGAHTSIGSPDRLLVDRADVRASVRQLESANAKRAAAYASLAPTLTLTGQYGRQYLTVDETEDVENWGLGAVATLPLRWRPYPCRNQGCARGT